MTTEQTKKLQKGFTLIELLVVIGILAILLSIVLVAINPARQFAQANNTKRNSDVQAILNAIHQYAADHSGTLPTGLSASMAATYISDNTATGLGTNAMAFCQALVTTYIAALPRDPKTDTGANVTDCAASYNTGYQVAVGSTDGRITISAPGTESPLATPISLTR